MCTAVNSFSKVNEMVFGYFDTVHMFVDEIIRTGVTSSILRLKDPLVLSIRLRGDSGDRNRDESDGTHQQYFDTVNMFVDNGNG